MGIADFFRRAFGRHAAPQSSAPGGTPINTGVSAASSPLSAPPPQRPALSEADHLRAAMDAAGMRDPDLRAGIAAIAMGESAMRGHVERGYGGTSNSRIRQVFGARVAGLSEAQLDDLKRDDRAFFERVYGGAWGARSLGNTMPGDGFRFRGRGFIQLTGRANYERYGRAIGRLDALLANPDLANDPAVSAELTAAYIKDRYKGGGWGALVACVGNNTSDIRARKDAYYRQFRASGEFA